MKLLKERGSWKALDGLIAEATGAWSASLVRDDGRVLSDLTGNGRHMRPGGIGAPAYLDGNALVLPGLADNHASAPDEAALDITGDIDIRFAGTVDNLSKAAQQTMVSKWAVGQNSFILNVHSDQRLRLAWGNAAGAVFAQYATVNITAVATNNSLLLARATLDVDNGASGYEVKFYTKQSSLANAHSDLLSDEGWGQLGTTAVGGAPTNIKATTTVVSVGSIRESTQAPLAGKALAAVIKDGIGAAGTTVLDVDFSDGVPNAPTLLAKTGQTVTINKTAITTTNDPRRLAYTGERYLFVDGVLNSGAVNSVSVPDEAALDITGDLDVIVRVGIPNWAWNGIRVPFIGRWTGTVQWYLARTFAAVNGELEFRWFDGSGVSHVVRSGQAPGSSAVAVDEPRWLRVTLDVDNGAGGHVVRFFKSDDDANDPASVTWTQVGTDKNDGAFTTSIRSSPQATILPWGGGNLGGGAQDRFDGRLYRAIIKDGIDGTPVLDIDFTDPEASIAPHTTVTAKTGQTVTLNGRATLVTSTRLFLDGVDDYLSTPLDPVFVIGEESTVVIAMSRSAIAIPNHNYISNGRLAGSATPGWIIYSGGQAVTLNQHDGVSNAYLSLGAETPLREVFALGAYLDVGDPATIAEKVQVGAGAAKFQILGAAIFVGRVLTASEIAQVARELAYDEPSLALDVGASVLVDSNAGV